jgi:hypothetical protein
VRQALDLAVKENNTDLADNLRKILDRYQRDKASAPPQ